MQIRQAFPSRFLRAADMTGDLTVTIGAVRREKIGDAILPVISFADGVQPLVLNKTNAAAIADLLGTEETLDWEGQSITLYPTTTDFRGKSVPCIRVRDSRGARAQRSDQAFDGDDSDPVF